MAAATAADGLKQVLAKPIQLADLVSKTAGEVQTSRTDCQELKSKSERLAALLRQAARADLYERPTRRIMDDTEHALNKALALVTKCRAQGNFVRRVFTIVPAAAFKKMSSQLENSIGDVSWLLRVSKSPSSTANGDDDDDDGYLGLPPIAANEPILCLIWEQIAKLHKGFPEDKVDAAASLVSLARDNDRYGKLIIEEGGIGPLLRLVKEGKVEGQESAALALGLLGRDPESVEAMVASTGGACSVFTKILKEGPMKVQAMVAWAVSELAGHYPHCQDMFAQHHAVRFLVGHLAFETIQEHSKYTIPKATSIHSVVVANTNATAVHSDNNAHSSQHDEEGQSKVKHPMGNHAQAARSQMHSVVQSTMAAKPNGITTVKHQHTYSSGGIVGIRGREQEDPATKAHMKAMAARALWKLSKGNSTICKSITESRALLCFAVLLEKGAEEVQYNSAMALMEIGRVAERDADLRRFAFKPSSPTAKAVVDQLLRVVEKGEYTNLLVPCVVALGCLSKTFRATETRIIGPMVRLLDEREPDVMREAAIALTKFAGRENYLRKDHAKAIVAEGGTKHLVQLVYFGEHGVQMPALVLLCNIALSVPDSEELANAEVLTVLEWASKQSHLLQDSSVDEMLLEAKSKLELYQSRGSRGFH